MAFITVNRESVAKEGTGSFATTSGIYDVNLKACEIATTKGGATQANYFTDKFMSYGNTVINKQGKPIFGMDILEALAAVLGEDGLSDPESTEVKFKNSSKDLMCLPELTDVDVKVWVQFSYSKWNGEIQEKLAVKRFYRSSDNASGSEIVNAENGDKVVFGTQLAKDEAYASEVKYEDGITEEDVKAWKKAKSDAAKGNKPQASTTAASGATTSFPKRA